MTRSRRGSRREHRRFASGFGKHRVESAADTLATISSALRGTWASGVNSVPICWNDFSDLPLLEHVKVVGVMNYAEVSPGLLRGLVHDGCAGTIRRGPLCRSPSASILWEPAGSGRSGGARVQTTKGWYRTAPFTHYRGNSGSRTCAPSWPLQHRYPCARRSAASTTEPTESVASHRAC